MCCRVARLVLQDGVCCRMVCDYRIVCYRNVCDCRVVCVAGWCV